eukprot:scaffold39996_cov57-Phaeocystis_antarctica.AAC.2
MARLFPQLGLLLLMLLRHLPPRCSLALLGRTACSRTHSAVRHSGRRSWQLGLGRSRPHSFRRRFRRAGACTSLCIELAVGGLELGLSALPPPPRRLQRGLEPRGLLLLHAHLA